MANLTMFYGTECVHCHEMMPLLKKLQKEEKIKVAQVEVWHNSKNKAKMDKINTMKCTGVPFLYNEKTKKGICGSVSYDKLKTWAKGK
jgi:thiol-disulfide isomerase/thioredoxin